MKKLPATLLTASLLVNQEVIAAYADLTNDFNPIHIDPEFAAKTAMGGIIAHGTMSVSLIWQALEKSLGAANLAEIELDIRFIRPVRLGDHLVASGKLQESSQKTYEVWVRDEQDQEDRIVGSATCL